MSDQPKHTGEWTVEELQRIINDSGVFWRNGLVSAHNAALAAKQGEIDTQAGTVFNALWRVSVVVQARALAIERATIQQLRSQLADMDRDYKIACTMRDNHAKQLEVVLPIRVKLEQQLAVAHAAMKAHNDDPEMVAKCGEFNLTDTTALDAAIAKATDGIRQELSQAEAALQDVTAAQQPLVDALRTNASMRHVEQHPRSNRVKQGE